MNFLGKYYNGDLTFQDLWRGHLEHRTLGYNIIFLLNAIFFHLNTTLEMYFGAFILAITSIILFKNYSRSLHQLGNDKYKQFSSLFIIMLLFSLIQWESIVFSLGIAEFIKNLFFILTFVYLDLVINFRTRKNIIVFILFFICSILVFGGGYGPALVLSMIIILIINLFISKSVKFSKNLKLLLYVLFLSSVLFLIYFYHIYEDNMVAEHASISQKISFIFHHFINAIKYVLLSISSSVVGVNVADKYFSLNKNIIIGTLIALLFVYSLIKFFKTKMYIKTWLPLLFFIYGFITFGLILVGRFDFGITYGMSSRYVPNTQFAIIGIVWILFYCLFLEIKVNASEVKKYKKTKIILYLLLIGVIFSGHLVTTIVEWKISPYRKINFEKLRTIAMDIDKYSSSDLNMFQYDESMVRNGLKILQKNNLSVYYDYKGQRIGSNLTSANLISGWYPIEGEFRWTSKEAIGYFNIESESNLHIQGNIPDVYSNLVLSISIDDKIIMKSELKNGDFDISKKVEQIGIKKVTLSLSDSFIPKQTGNSKDERELGIIIKSISFKRE
ncbi:hypothetical protein [Paenibacillus psychroresistens]|uniref:hypothetical protein n=1 Tax=Paenibacillus psychroresistens TaxID=1778678 RepID=UPI001D041540|nr:hypothetical protein [Paenibacillus psychroresistens]